LEKDKKYDLCPYCRAKIIEKDFIRPWGFSPISHESLRSKEENEAYSFTEAPYYSYVPEETKMVIFEDTKIRYVNRPNYKVLIINMGRDKNGFNVCKTCGCAEIVPFNEQNKNIVPKQCQDQHSSCDHKRNVAHGIYLGFEFLTDMFMLDISYDSDKLVLNGSKEEKFILRAAVTTLHEAIKKAISITLDIDYNEINGGWRPRIKNNGQANIEMYFYDSLSSGAGYSSLIGDILEKVLEKTRVILSECECSRSCKNCLDNYYNQRQSPIFDRYLALDLLNYAQKGELPNDYDQEKQDKFLQPLEKLIKETSSKKAPPNTFTVMHSILKKPKNTSKKIYFNPYDLTDWLPKSFVTCAELLKLNYKDQD
jgi:hypothetical protein